MESFLMSVIYKLTAKLLNFELFYRHVIANVLIFLTYKVKTRVRDVPYFKF